MVNPVPGYGISTAYGKRGSYWSCNRNSSGQGIHTGADLAAPAGARVVAARGGKAQYVNFGSSFGYHQLAILPGDGTRDFYAHMPSRAVADGSQVAAGATVGKVGTEGNVTGPHLHFERHKVASGGWSCSVVTDPAPSINSQAAAGGGSGGGAAGGGSSDKVKVDPVPDFVNVTDPDGWKVGSDDWAPISWQGISSDSKGVASKGNPGLDLGGCRYSATLTLRIAGATVASVWTRPIEGDFSGKGGAWTVTKTGSTASHVVPSKGDLYLTDTRQGNCAKGKKLRWQLNASKGAQVKVARLEILYWKV